MAANEDHQDKRRASQRVADALRRRIDAGEFTPKAQLPTYRQLATEYDVAVNTALNAIRLLRDAGLVAIRPNAGAYVLDPSEQVDLAAEITRTQADLADLRASVQQMDSSLSAMEDRLSKLVSRLDESQ